MTQDFKQNFLFLSFLLAMCVGWYYFYVKPADDSRFPIIKCSYELGGPTRENLATCSDRLHPNP